MVSSQGPTFVPASPHGRSEMEVIAGKHHNNMLDESTDLESEESSSRGAPTEETSFSFFDTCCSFGTSTCPICHQPIGMSDAVVTMRKGGEDFYAHLECVRNRQRMRSQNAIKIQSLARGNRAREKLRIEIAERESAARRAFELEAQVMEAAEKAAMEADREQSKLKKKKSLVKKLFGGCVGSKSKREEDSD